MFEKESKEYANKWLEHVKDLELQHKSDDKPEYIRILEAHQKGAEFGYNKANEWHYPSKGKYPEENKRYLCKIKAFVGGGIYYECFDYDTEYNSWKNSCGEVIAWKEIVLPELPGEN